MGTSHGFREEVARPALRQFVSNVVRALLLFTYQVVVARVFGAAVLGLFALATSATQVAGMISQLGGDYVILRGRTPGGTAYTPESGVRAMAVPVFFALLGSSAVLAAVALGTDLLGSDRRVASALISALPSIAALTVSTVLAAYLQAKRRFLSYAVVQTVLEPLLRIAVLIILVIAVDSWLTPIWSYTVSTVLAAVFAASLLPKDVFSTPLRSSEINLGFSSLSYSIPVMLTFALQFATLFLNVTLLTRLMTPAEAGLFSAAMRVAMLTLWAQMAFSTPFLPRVSAALEHPERRAELRSTYQQMVRLVVIMNVPLMAGLFIARHSVMQLFGTEFTQASTALGLLLLGQLANSSTALAEGILPLGGKSTLGVFNNTLQLAVNFILALALIPDHGVGGAALAVAISVVGINVLRTVQVWHYWRIHPLSGGLLKTVGAGILSTGALEWLMGDRLNAIILPFGLAAGCGASILAFGLAMTTVGREDSLIIVDMLRIGRKRPS